MNTKKLDRAWPIFEEISNRFWLVLVLWLSTARFKGLLFLSLTVYR